MQKQIEKFTRQELKKWNLQGWTLRFGSAKRQAGSCNYTKKRITISLVLAKARGIEATKETVLHEIAHALAGHEAGHGLQWKQWAKRVGAKPERCFIITDKIQKQIAYKYTAKCPVCGKEIHFSRQWKYSRSCGKCHPGSYNSKFKLTVRQNF